MIQPINLAEKFSLFTEHWVPKVVADLGDSYVKLAKIKGEFVWHAHEHEDELFFVVKGNLIIKLRDGDLRLGPGELAVIPKGVEHLPVADDEVYIMLIEPKSTINTGDVCDERKIDMLDRI